MKEKDILWEHTGIHTPPFSPAARKEAGDLLRILQGGEMLSMPHSRPMPSIAPHCHELRIRDADHNWRIIYRIDPDEIVVVVIFDKKTERVPKSVDSSSGSL